MAREAIYWTHGQLSAKAKTFLAQLPMTAHEDDRLYVHSDASAPAEWHYVTSADEARVSLQACEHRITFCGHVHVPALYALSAADKIAAHTPAHRIAIPLIPSRRWLAVLGAVGQPRDGDPAAALSIYDTETAELMLLRVPYDVESVVSRIRALGRPEGLATRLLQGR